MTFEELVERYAIRIALGNNGGTWAIHYTEDQKNFWRNMARELIEEARASK